MKKKINDWIASINDELTFAGVVVTYFDEICERNHWNAESTRNQYKNDYSYRIIPYLDNHDITLIKDYVLDDYRYVIDCLKEIDRVSDARLLHFMRLIGAVSEMANEKLGCQNITLGTAFELKEEFDAKEKIRELVKLKKSLTPKQEIVLYNLLMNDYKMSGERFGILLMLVLGLRNGEACAVTFGDFIESYVDDGFHVLLMYKTVESKNGKIVSSGKTKNADRIIPVPEVIYKYIMKRKEYVASMVGKSADEVDDYPIACSGDDYLNNCTPGKLSYAAKVAFIDVGVSARVLSYIDYDIITGDTAVITKEKDPTAYLLRRNFATQMAIIGMNEYEIQYLIGHDVTDAYETRNEIVDINKLRVMRDKINKRGLFYINEKRLIDMENYGYDVVMSQTISESSDLEIKCVEGDYMRLIVEGVEPGDDFKCEILTSKLDYHWKNLYKSSDYNYDRTACITEKYHVVYDKAKRNRAK